MTPTNACTHNPEAIYRIARPLIFETEYAQYPYLIKGSSFFISNEPHYYWITASHAIDINRESVKDLRIFPSDTSKISLPFNEQYEIKRHGDDDEDFKDVFLLRIDMKRFDRFGDSCITALDIDVGLLPPESLVEGDELCLFGFPAARNHVDFDTRTISQFRLALRARYIGLGLSAHCHTAVVEAPTDLDSYDGLSGSPIFAKRRVNSAETGASMLLVGMVLRGTAESRCIHFVSSTVINDFVKLA
jgi:hypothetical protein